MSPHFNFCTWDANLNNKNIDLESLYQDMISYAIQSDNKTDIEVMYRLCQVTYLCTLNLTKTTEIKAKTIESFEYGENAVKLNGKHFDSNLWLACAAGKLSLIETDSKKKSHNISVFLNSLNICIDLAPTNYLVLFMEARLQLALHTLSDVEREMINCAHLNLPPLNLGLAETKIRKSIEYKGNFIDAFITLVYILLQAKRFDDALNVAEKGLSIERLNERITRSDELVASELEKIKSTIKERK